LIDPKCIRAVQAEHEKFDPLLRKLRRTVYEIMNGDAQPEALQNIVLEWQEISKRFKAQGTLAYVIPGDLLVMVRPLSAEEKNPLYHLPDENPQ
jgi:hypothetical protein